MYMARFVGLGRRIILLNLQNQSGQTVLSMQHSPSQRFNRNQNHDGGTIGRSIGSFTTFTDSTGRVVMVAAGGHGGVSE